MNDILLFVWGFIAFLLAVGPLAVAAILDRRDGREKSSSLFSAVHSLKRAMIKFAGINLLGVINANKAQEWSGW